MQAVNLPGLIDKPKAAEILGISLFTINTWVSQKKIPFIKLGRRVLFDLDELAKFIKSHSVQPSQEA